MVNGDGQEEMASFDHAIWARRIRVALGQEPADLLLAGGQVVDVFGGSVFAANVAIADGRIAGVGDYTNAAQTIDVSGRYVAPSFIDGHVHLESALVWVTEFARAVVPRGTGAVVTDPHEIANVAGLPGIAALRTSTAILPLHVAFTAPSCIPASPMESPGATFDLAEIAEVLSWPETVALGELMNFPGVLAGDPGLAAKVRLAGRLRCDGHAPGMRGRALQAYAGAGPGSDHESTELDEAREKLRAGLMLMIREGSSEHNLHELLPLVDDRTYGRCCFGSDDRDCHLLLHSGHIDDILRQAIAAGLDPVRAIRMATWNAADYWRLEGLGAVAPGYRANLAILDDLRAVTVSATLFDGVVVARDGELLTPVPQETVVPEALRDSVNIAPLRLTDLRLAPENAGVAVELIPGQIVTRAIGVQPSIVDGWAVSNTGRDLLKFVCVERHNATGRVGVGYVHGFGLRSGALASTIAHDAHNIVAVGVEDSDILSAIATVADSQGGLAVVAGGRVLAHLPLPIGGLLSDLPLDQVATTYEELEAAARGLGSTLESPFGILAFMALSVIPEARITDRGFVRLGP